MEYLQWIFNGIGTELLSLAVGVIGGTFAGYRIGIKKSGKQTQKAKNGAKQRQELIVDDKVEVGDKGKAMGEV